MSVTYINISGNLCESYSSGPALPPNTSGFYMYTGSGAAGSPYFNASTFTVTQPSSQLSIDISDYQFIAIPSLSFLSSPTAGDWPKRYLEKYTSGASQTNVNNRVGSGTTADWTSLPGTITATPNGGASTAFNTISATPTGGLSGLIFTTIKYISSLSSGSNIPVFSTSSAIGGTAGYPDNLSGTGLTPTIGGDFPTSAPQSGTSGTFPRFYLIKIPTGLNAGSDFSSVGIFYKSYPPATAGGARVPGETDVYGNLDILASFVSSNICHQFTIRRITTASPNGYTLAVYTGDGTTQISDLTLSLDGSNNLIAQSTSLSSSTGSTVQYFFSTMSITDRTTGSYTLLRNGTKYVYWSGYNSGTQASSAVTTMLKDYWTNGITPTELGVRTVFFWEDLTPGTPTTVTISSGTRVDVYRWKFQNSLNYYLYYTIGSNDGGTLTVGPNSNASFPPANEGWAVIYLTTDDGTTGGFIGYVRKNKIIALMREDGSLPATVTTTAATATVAGSNYQIANANGITLTSSYPATFRYKCIKCSTMNGNLCAT